MTTRAVPVIVTDLDGTLLDHHSYSYEPAKPAVAELLRRGYPLILNSSKTRVELLALQDELGLRQPCICENGAAIYLPTDDGQWQCQQFAEPREHWLPAIHELRELESFAFEGFSDWSVEQLVDITGLGEAQAARAMAREFSEPLLWHGDDASRQAFAQRIAELGLRMVRGGRFYSLQGQFDKAQAMQWLRERYQEQQAVVLIALGDSPNDAAMLNAADIAVVIRSAQSEAIEVTGPERIIRTEKPGPTGWQQAMTTIMRELDERA